MQKFFYILISILLIHAGYGQKKANPARSNTRGMIVVADTLGQDSTEKTDKAWEPSNPKVQKKILEILYGNAEQLFVNGIEKYIAHYEPTPKKDGKCACSVSYLNQKDSVMPPLVYRIKRMDLIENGNRKPNFVVFTETSDERGPWICTYKWSDVSVFEYGTEGWELISWQPHFVSWKTDVGIEKLGGWNYLITNTSNSAGLYKDAKIYGIDQGLKEISSFNLLSARTFNHKDWDKYQPYVRLYDCPQDDMNCYDLEVKSYEDTRKFQKYGNPRKRKRQFILYERKCYYNYNIDNGRYEKAKEKRRRLKTLNY